MPYALPPAETRLSAHALAGGYLESSSDFAETLNRLLGVNNCVLANSARTLLYLLFCFLKSRAGTEKTEVLIPGYTCYTVPAAAVKAGLKVCLYDMDPYTFQPDADDAAKKMGPATLAVVGQHLLGIRSDMAGLAKAARQNNIYCIEDSAQLLKAQGPETQPQPGPDFTLYSFGRGKPLPLGAGGALTSARSKDLTKFTGSLKADSRTMRDGFLPFAVRFFSHPRLYWLLEKLPLGLGSTIYDPDFAVGPMPRLYRRMGVRAVKELENLNNHRQAISRIYRDFFAGKTSSGPAEPVSTCLRYPFFVRNQKAAPRLFNLGVRQLYPLALCDLPELQKNTAPHRADTPGARKIAEKLVTLPTHLAVSRNQALEIADRAGKTFTLN